MAKSTVASLDARLTAAIASLNHAFDEIERLRVQVSNLTERKINPPPVAAPTHSERGDIVLEQMIADLPLSLVGAARENAIGSLKRRIALRNKARNYN